VAILSLFKTLEEFKYYFNWNQLSNIKFLRVMDSGLIESHKPNNLNDYYSLSEAAFSNVVQTVITNYYILCCSVYPRSRNFSLLTKTGYYSAIKQISAFFVLGYLHLIVKPVLLDKIQNSDLHLRICIYNSHMNDVIKIVNSHQLVFKLDWDLSPWYFRITIEINICGYSSTLVFKKYNHWRYFE